MVENDDKSTFVRDEQPENIPLRLVTFVVSKFVGVKEVIEEQFKNIFCIDVAEVVFIDDNAMLCKLVQPENISLKLVTFSVLKLLMSIVLKL